VAKKGHPTIKVLLVDDHEVVQRDLARFLGTYDDIEVIGKASTGKEALQFCAEARPDVILMDLWMPIMDGLETTRAIVAIDPGIRIIVLTGSTDEGISIQAVQAGALLCLHKNSEAVKQLHDIILEVYDRPV
jgi:DNA-binding NarL/FixJ family response regulator